MTRRKLRTPEEVDAMGLDRSTVEYWQAIFHNPFQEWLEAHNIQPGALLEATDYPGPDTGLVEIPSGEKEAEGRVHPYYGDCSEPSKCTKIEPGSIVMFVGLNTYFNDDSGIFPTVSFLYEGQVVYWSDFFGGGATEILNNWLKPLKENNAA